MKPILLFRYDGYYPSGGWSDFGAAFDTEDDALREILWHVTDDVRAGGDGRLPWNFYDIVDLSGEKPLPKSINAMDVPKHPSLDDLKKALCWP